MSKKLDLSQVAKVKEPRAKKATAKNPAMGLGDVVEKITTVTGIKKIVEVFSAITGADCGCEERKEKMNDWFKKYRLKARCITQDEYHEIKEALIVKGRSLSREQARQIATLYSAVFSTRFEIWCDHCPEIWKTNMSHLQDVLNVYDEGLKELLAK
jgi:hypothetical protein